MQAVGYKMKTIDETDKSERTPRLRPGQITPIYEFEPESVDAILKQGD